MNFDIERKFGFTYNDKPLVSNIVEGDKYRITILNSRLVRFEYSDFHFVDKPTQKVLNRDFGQQQFSITETSELLTIETEYLVIHYNKQDFTKEGLSVVQKKALDQDTIWRYGQKDEKNLKGTARTLDNINGRVEMEDGINSLNGYGIIDDSESLLLNEDGSVTEREQCKDIYYFGYGLEFKQALKDFYKLTGNYPEIPKYMLGNWWSRFWEYSEQSVMEMVQKFEENDIPLSVFIFDMDWHLVDIDEKYGSGWTGFTWNKELFPEPKRIIDWLHARGIKVALNLHPADGFRAFEEDYEAIASELGIEQNSETPIAFDVTNQEFMDSYFKNFIEKNEELGVDFWWLDWQQGDVSAIKGLDPLWMLNHMHYLHHGINHETPATFSRYAGIGSHRYPIGFSGDTHMTWESLAFQPEFTVTSANVGYNYWSHDIGGHMYGSWDEELYRRWIQFGVYSPIMRLHSGKTAFIEKEPWENSYQTQLVAKKYMQLREQLVDFIHSENLKGSKIGSQLIEPVYFDYPEEKRVYDFKSQYMFGGQLLIAPITTAKIKSINLSKTGIYLPKGTWYDQNGFKYGGQSDYIYYADELDYPVFRKTGSILPLTTSGELVLDIIPGNGKYTFVSDEASCDIELKFSNNKLIVTYSKDLCKYGAIKVKSNPRFILEKEEVTEEDNLIKITFNVEEKSMKVSKQELEKLIKDFDFEIKIKYMIEDDMYILNDEADVLSRINAVNCLPIEHDQREAIIAILMKK